MPTNIPLRRYQKDDSSPLEPREVLVIDDMVDISLQINENNHAKQIEFQGRLYTKKLEGKRDYYLIVIIVEDEKRTPSYFAPISEQNLRGFVVKPIKKDNNGIPPSHMKKEAENCEIIYGLDFSVGDELYMVCDLDHYRIQLERLNIEKNPNWKLIISNPCIELWFYYHLESTKPTFVNCKMEAKYSKQMKQMCGQLRGGAGVDQTMLLRPACDIRTPIENAKNTFALETSSSFMPDLGSTQMFILMERINIMLN